MKTKTEQALARIFAHCDAVVSGEKPTPSVEDGKKMAAAFLGEMNTTDQPRAALTSANTTSSLRPVRCI